MRRLLQRTLALLTFAVTPVAAQQGDYTAKSPTTARIIGIIPGAGHMYAGETGRGWAYLGGVAGLALVGSALVATDCVVDVYSGSGSETCPSSTAENVLVVAFVGLWGWSIYDAGRAAHRMNEKHGLRTSLIIAPRGGQGVRVGLSFAAR